MTVDRSEVNQMSKFLAALGNTPEMLAERTGRPIPPESRTIATAAPMVSAPVSLQSISEMTKFMKALNGNPATITAAPSPLRVYSEEPMLAELQSEDMLGRFYTSTTNVISEAPIDKSLREALVLEKTKNGARIGNWEIVVYENGKKKTYDVRHKDTNECIASELSLYDAACGLARALNEGHFINSKDVIELMNSEVAYTSAVNDMVLYKHHLKKNPNSARATLYETRYSEAKRKAISAKERVSILAESF